MPPFLGSALAFMMVYVWGRRNEHVRMSFLGLSPFRAPYLRWGLLGWSARAEQRRAGRRETESRRDEAPLRARGAAPRRPPLPALRSASPVLPGGDCWRDLAGRGGRGVPTAPLPLPPPRQVMLGNSPSVDLMGIGVGHIYFFLEAVLPHTQPAARSAHLDASICE